MLPMIHVYNKSFHRYVRQCMLVCGKPHQTLCYQSIARGTIDCVSEHMYAIYEICDKITEAMTDLLASTPLQSSPHKPVVKVCKWHLICNFFYSQNHRPPLVFSKMKIEMNLLWKAFSSSSHCKLYAEKARAHYFLFALCMGKTEWNVLCNAKKRKKYKFSYDFVFLLRFESLLQVVYRFFPSFHPSIGR